MQKKPPPALFLIVQPTAASELPTVHPFFPQSLFKQHTQLKVPLFTKNHTSVSLFAHLLFLQAFLQSFSFFQLIILALLL